MINIFVINLLIHLFVTNQLQADFPQLLTSRQKYMEKQFLPTHIDISHYQKQPLEKILAISLRPWYPKSIRRVGKQVRISLPYKTIPPIIYRDLVKIGVCGYLWTNQVRWPDSKIVVLNDYLSSGFIFSGNAQDCANFGNLVDKDLNQWIQRKTQNYQIEKIQFAHPVHFSIINFFIR